MTYRNAFLALASVALVACGGEQTVAVQLTGAGATFPNPVYSKWFDAYYTATGHQVNYQSVGSGAGVKQFSEGTVDFGATDGPMTDAEIAAVNGAVIHIPTVLGADVVTWNLPSLGATQLKFDGATLADIFLGKIKKWNDPKIAGQNSGARLPSTSITVCHRSDESGTTANFTSFLTAYSSAWKSGPGTDKSVKWPTGTGAKGNDGVAGCVRQTKGAVGYVEQAYALQNKFTTAAVKNTSGEYVEPSLQATSAAASGITPPGDLRFSTIDSKNPDAYPISAVTFLLVWQDACKAGQNETQAKLVKNWLTYALGAGQQVAPQLEYAPLPDNVKTKAQAKVDGLRCNGAAIGGAS
jgi:phosphate transport system substrate-binding protein